MGLHGPYRLRFGSNLMYSVSPPFASRGKLVGFPVFHRATRFLPGTARIPTAGSSVGGAGTNSPETYKIEAASPRIIIGQNLSLDCFFRRYEIPIKYP